MESSMACPVCGKTSLKLFLNGQTLGLTLSSVGASRAIVSPGRILRCADCRFAFREERPTSEELSALYQQMDVGVYESQFRGREKSADRLLRIVERYRSDGELLDVGCASGTFLKHAIMSGWTATGIEPSAELCHRAQEAVQKKARILCATLETAELKPNSFDVITSWDVLEHMQDPVGFMRGCASLLRDDGLLFTTVPNLDSLTARLLGSRWPMFLPEHLNYFNPKSLKLCGALAGLTCLHVGRRTVFYSTGYVLTRLSQHRIPGASLGNRMIALLGIEQTSLPIHLGDVWCAWRKSHSTGPDA
jgi:SAM-dependent methyltransferase